MAAAQKKSVEELARLGGRNLVLLFVIVAIAIAGMYFYTQQQAQQLAAAQQTPATLASQGRELSLSSAEVEPLMFSYNDEEYNFTIKYSKTYKADLNPDGVTRLRFTAQNPASTFDKILSAEVIDVRVTDLADPAAYFSGQQAADNLASEIGAAYNKTAINGANAFLAQGFTASDVTGERLIVRAGFFDCRTADGTPYTAGIVAIIPPNLELDALYATYIINSFKC